MQRQRLLCGTCWLATGNPLCFCEEKKLDFRQEKKITRSGDQLDLFGHRAGDRPPSSNE